MNYIRTQSRIWGQYALLGTGAIFGLMMCLYTIFVFQTISFTASKQHTHTAMSVTNGRLSDLESQYMTLKNKITSQTAIELGFKEVAIRSYVSRPSRDLSLRPIQ